MPAEAMLTFLNNCTPEGKLGFQVATQCAPVLKGIKVSNLITVPPGTWNRIRLYLGKSRVICVSLYADSDKEILFLYRDEMLAQLLQQGKVWRFLQQYGYQTSLISDTLTRLRRRYQRYASLGDEFPHELGVLLEYPVEDVEGFINNRGQNSLMARYWKVYHDQVYAERMFRLYDEAREKALEEILKGYPLDQVAV